MNMKRNDFALITKEVTGFGTRAVLAQFYQPLFAQIVLDASEQGPENSSDSLISWNSI